MEHLKRDITWTARGELIHEGVPVVGSNVVDLVNDLLRKSKTAPTGWQPFARQLRAINLPMTTHRLRDDLGEVLEGTFYELELQKVTVPFDKVYRVEAVLKRRTVGRRKEALVKWFGYSSYFNSWIDAKGLVNYKA